MKKTSILLVLLWVTSVVFAQEKENNRKGMEALNNLDYSTATIWFQEQVYSDCDLFSIDKLTQIWYAADSLREYMSGIMGQCLKCLEESASVQKNTESYEKIITYYTQGIGTEINPAKAEEWQSQLDAILNPYPDPYGQNGRKPPREKQKMQFFAGYSANLLAPAGITVGGVGGSVGWYLRFRTNLSFTDYTEECGDDGRIIGGLNNGNSLPESLGVTKTNMLIGTGGIVIKVSPSLYLSAGVGYCNREFLRKYQSIGIVESEPEGEFWAKQTSASFGGLAFDLDGTFKIGKSFYGSAGVSLLNKYVYPNAGIGVFF